MTLHINPALRQESRNQPIKVVPPIPRETLLDWLERTGRLRLHEAEDIAPYKTEEEIDSILDPELYASDDEDEESD